MKILITGANGFIAQHLVNRLLDKHDHLVIAAARGSSRLPFNLNKKFQFHSLDITDIETTEKLLLLKPDVVIHAAALGQPDYCELNKGECNKINIQSTESIITACKKINAYLLFVSTDFVFNGEGGPYKEDDFIDPINYYGASKVKGEELCMKSGLSYSVIRLCSVYGKSIVGENRNVVIWTKQNLQNNKTVKVADDLVRTPTYIDDVISAIVTMIERKANGIFHIAGAEILTPYQMAIRTADYFGLDKTLIEKVASATFTQPAKRPMITGLVIDKAKKDLQFSPVNFEEGLHAMFGDEK